MTDCIFYDGTHKMNGYGFVYVGSRTKRAHKVAWEAKFGKVPEGYVLDHICHNETAIKGECEGGPNCQHRSCINTDHLRVITQQENILSGLHSIDVKATCPQGHDYRNPDNIMIRANGKRECAECNRERGRRNWAKRKVA
jgi:hypothetical protein